MAFISVQVLILPNWLNFMETECYKNVKNAKANFSVILEHAKQQKCSNMKPPENVKNVGAHFTILSSISDKNSLNIR